MHEHTPGPWHLSPTGKYVRYGTPPHGPNIADTDVFGGPLAEGVANARLIAAAPDLLESLELLVGAVSAPDTPCRAGVLEMRLAEARAAIARATKGA